MKMRTCTSALLLACAGAAHVQAAAQDGIVYAQEQHGAYLSAAFGNGRMHGMNDGGTRWMRGRAFEVRAGREEAGVFGGGRIDFVHYNEGHPENNHRDGFALQWLAVRPLGARFTGELGIGPYLSMNTTAIDGRQIDDTHLGLLLSAALRLPLDFLPEGTHVRLGLNYAWMRDVHRSTALVLGIGRQFGPARPAPELAASGRTWYGVSVGNAITNLSDTDGAWAGTLEARRYLGGKLENWAVSAKYVHEGDDGARVDRKGVAAQAWYVQQVTPRLSVSAGIGPYLAHNRRDRDEQTRGNLLISFQAERALSDATRVFVNFNRVKTFRETDERDLFQIGVLKRF